MRILIEKNSRLAALEEKLSEQGLMSVTSDPGSPGISDENIRQTQDTHISKEKLTSENQPDDFEINLYNQHILTPADWLAFKIYFEKAYPGYLFRLRNAFPAISEAEERLFLFIKLKLANKEAAAILGISVDSVRKTRTRLRKRMEISQEVNLEEYIARF
jgi:DNA-binding CsgD family transcriptional regulator